MSDKYSNTVAVRNMDEEISCKRHNELLLDDAEADIIDRNGELTQRP